MAIPLEEDGYLTFTLKGQEVSLDIYEANNAYAALAAQSGSGPELGRAWRDWLAERGLVVSEGVAYQVISEVQKAVIEFKKKRGWADSPRPDSNDSSATPSAA